MRTLAWLLVLTLGCGSDTLSPCDEAEGVPYDVRVVRFPTRFEDPLVPIANAEVCLLEPACGCHVSDGDGRLRVSLPPERALLLEASAPGYLPTLTTHVTGTTPRFAQLVLLDESTATILAATVGQRLDDERGQLGIRVAATADGDVTGTTFALRNLDTGETHPFVYVHEGVPDPSATATDGSGSAVAVNLPPGRYRIESETFATCTTVDSGLPAFEGDRWVGLESPVAAGSVTLLDVLQCVGVR